MQSFLFKVNQGKVCHIVWVHRYIITSNKTYILIPCFYLKGKETDKRGETSWRKSTNTKRFSEVFWHGDNIRRFRYYFGENQRNIRKTSIWNAMGSEKLGFLMIWFPLILLFLI